MTTRVKNMALLGANKNCKSEKYPVACALNAEGYNSVNAIYDENSRVNDQARVYVGWHDHNEELIVDMPLCDDPEKSNADGWLRNKKYYFERIQERNPEAISERNNKLIKADLNIIVDKEFIACYPEYKEFEGDVLIHHHIGGGRQAVAIPSRLHINNVGIHQDEKRLGLNETAKEYSDFCKQELRENPEISDEVLQNEYIKTKLEKNEIEAEGNDLNYDQRRESLKQLMGVLDVPSSYAQRENIKNGIETECSVKEFCNGNTESTIENKEKEENVEETKDEENFYSL